MFSVLPYRSVGKDTFYYAWGKLKYVYLLRCGFNLQFCSYDDDNLFVLLFCYSTNHICVFVDSIFPRQQCESVVTLNLFCMCILNTTNSTHKTETTLRQFVVA